MQVLRDNSQARQTVDTRLIARRGARFGCGPVRTASSPSQCHALRAPASGHPRSQADPQRPAYPAQDVIMVFDV